MIYEPISNDIRWMLCAQLHADRFKVLETMRSVEIVMTDDSEKFYCLQLAYYHQLTDRIIVLQEL